MKTSPSHPVYRHLGELAGSSGPMRELLRRVQDRSEEAKADVNISGNKSDLVENLRQAVRLKHLTFSEVEHLLWDLEEVGRQHILLLKPAPKPLAKTEVDVRDGRSVAEVLFDEQPIEDLFPRFEFPTQGYVWGDFRILEDGSWIAKAYGLESYRQSQGVVNTEELDDGVYQETRSYVWREVKTTLVARWRADSDILELRIDITGLQNEKTIEERRASLWQLFRPAFDKSDFVGAHIDNLLKSLIFERNKPENAERYSISRVELTDPSSGQVRVIPRGSEELDHDSGRKASLEEMERNSFVPSLARVEWKTGLNDCPSDMTEPISVVIEKTNNGPELRILKRLTNSIYEYIFNQLQCRL